LGFLFGFDYFVGNNANPKVDGHWVQSNEKIKEELRR